VIAGRQRADAIVVTSIRWQGNQVVGRLRSIAQNTLRCKATHYRTAENIRTTSSVWRWVSVFMKMRLRWVRAV